MDRKELSRQVVKWITISTIVIGSLIMIPLQSDYWPFSSYSMFTFRFDSRDETDFVILGFTDGSTNAIQVIDQNVLGPIKHGYLSQYCRAKIRAHKNSCLQDSLAYWAMRYQLFEKKLPKEIQGFHSMKVVEINSKIEMASVSLKKDGQ